MPSLAATWRTVLASTALADLRTEPNLFVLAVVGVPFVLPFFLLERDKVICSVIFRGRVLRVLSKSLWGYSSGATWVPG